MQITRAPRRHLGPSEVVARVDACPICLCHETRRAVYRVQEDPSVHMLACPRCGACSASHMPSPDVLRDYYGHYYEGCHRGVTLANTARLAAHIVEHLPARAFGGAVRILDYGGGDGTLSVAVAQRLIAARRTSNADVQVIDYALHENHAGDGISVRYRAPGIIDGSFDIVLASAILEHVPDLHALLESLHDAVAAGGFFFARTPYAIPLTRLFPRLDLTYPAHVHDMGSEFWDRFAETFGWPVRVILSAPSLTASTFSEDPLRAIASTALKLPSRVFGRRWPFVGGWEFAFQKNEIRGRTS